MGNNEYVNNAFGNVGMQIGSVGSMTGNTFFNNAQPQPPSPHDHVRDLTLAVVKAHEAGRVDTDTFVSVMRALGEVRSQLAGTGRRDQARLADAIRRLDILLGGVPELRAKVRALEALRGAL